MAVGSAFDSFVKAELAHLLGKHSEQKVLLAQLLKTVDDRNSDCIIVGKKLFEEYNYQGCVRRLMDDGLTDIELESQRDILGKEVQGTEKTIGAVPVFCKPDAKMVFARRQIYTTKVFFDAGIEAPIDWKVTGAFSQSGGSPKPGYLRSYKNGCDNGRHERYGIPLEDIDQYWATQLTFYNWVLNNTEGPLPAAIEQVVVAPDSVRFVSYRTYISHEYANGIRHRLVDFWERLHSGQIKDPVPSLWTCEPFGNPRPCTVVCSAYKKTLGNPMERFQ